MRLKIILEYESSESAYNSSQSNFQIKIPINYNYLFASAIYDLLRFSSPKFSTFLHDKGFSLNGKKYKLFTFAVRFKNFLVNGSDIILNSPQIELLISTPLINDFIKNFVIGSFKKSSMKINSNGYHFKFNIKYMETLPEINFQNLSKENSNDSRCEINFIALSPIVLSTKKLFNGELKQYYLRPEDIDEINYFLTENLKNKYQILYNHESNDSLLELEWDKHYISKKKRITKKITINENENYPIDIIGIQAPFKIKGDPELIKVGYKCGFGMVNII